MTGPDGGAAIDVLLRIGSPAAGQCTSQPHGGELHDASEDDAEDDWRDPGSWNQQRARQEGRAQEESQAHDAACSPPHPSGRCRSG
jgi:hypothetical protein